MGSSARNKTIYFFLFSVVLCVWFCGSNGTVDTFKIFRSERDIFTNLNCRDSRCTNSTQRCEMYNAECVNATCEYCRCLEGANTLMMIEDGERKCKRNEEIVPESVPQEAFSLKNDQFDQCLKSNDGSKYLTGVYCNKSPTSDMLWIWSNIEEDKQLINVKTLKCMERKGNNEAVTMEQCENTCTSQKILCTSKEDSKMNIGWEINKEFLHFGKWKKKNYAISLRLKRWWCLWWCQKPQPWSSKNACKTSKVYKGCYRFLDGSFMKYLDYSQTTLTFSAPIFKEHGGKCKVKEIFKFIRDDQEWKGNGSDHFYINRRSEDTKVLEIKSMENLKAWNGSLLILNISCGNEESEEVHCILLKLKSLPPYPEVFPTSNQIATHNYTSTREVPFTFPWVNSTPPITTLSRDSKFTKDQKTPTKRPSQSPTPTTYATENPQEGFNEETSKSHGTNSTVFAIAIPVTVTLLLIALALLYNKKRKRARVPQSNNNDLAAVSYSKEIYEDPDRVYETTDGKEPLNQPENAMSSSTYCYPGMDIINNPAGTEQEYTYAKDMARPPVTSKVATEDPISNEVVYETLKEPGQPTDNTNIICKGLSELEYTYANDTDLPRDTADEKAVSERDSVPATSNSLYHTLEEEPTPKEHEYSYAKNTDMPSIPQSIVQRSNSPFPNSSLYHTLEKPNPPQVPVYSTLEEPEDLENHK